jgi:hypothetical protein
MIFLSPATLNGRSRSTAIRAAPSSSPNPDAATQHFALFHVAAVHDLSAGVIVALFLFFVGQFASQLLVVTLSELMSSSSVSQAERVRDTARIQRPR